MTTDFETAARAEAERLTPEGTSVPVLRAERDNLVHMAEWARTYLAEQEVSDAERAVRKLHHPVEVEPSDTICAACSTLRGEGESLRYFPTAEWPCATIQALHAALPAARAVGRDAR